MGLIVGFSSNPTAGLLQSSPRRRRTGLSSQLCLVGRGSFRQTKVRVAAKLTKILVLESPLRRMAPMLSALCSPTLVFSVGFHESDDLGEDALLTAFAGRQPDLIVVDAAWASDLLPLRRLRRHARQIWGGTTAAPSCFALLDERQLAQPDWMAFVDDFVLAPFRALEITARINLLLFRKGFLTAPDCLSMAGLTLRANDGTVTALGESQPIALTPREYELLRFLLVHRGKFFTRSRLLDLVWGVDFTGGERTVDIHVRRLRAKLTPEAGARLETRRNVGYGFHTGTA